MEVIPSRTAVTAPAPPPLASVPAPGTTTRADVAAPAAPTPTRPPRSAALDRLRGVALVAMLVHHVTEWLTGDARAVLPGWRSFSLTDAAAVAFFVAAGASMALFVAARRRRGAPRRRVGAQVLRRYGLLVPIGVALDWSFWRDPRMFGVLEALGTTVVLGALVAAVVPRRALPVVTAGMVWFGVWTEHAVEGRTDWWSDEVLAGKFPLVTYLGFVLIGVTVVRTGWYADRRGVTAAAGVAALVAIGLIADGLVPDRYPGDVHFVVPGLAVTIIVYALAQLPRPPALAPLDRGLCQAGAHTLGIFVAHYAVYGVLRHAGLLGEIPGAVAVPAALAVTGAACVLAPKVPQPAWSVRTGWRRGARRRAVGSRPDDES